MEKTIEINEKEECECNGNLLYIEKFNDQGIPMYESKIVNNEKIEKYNLDPKSIWSNFKEEITTDFINKTNRSYSKIVTYYSKGLLNNYAEQPAVTVYHKYNDDNDDDDSNSSNSSNSTDKVLIKMEFVENELHPIIEKTPAKQWFNKKGDLIKYQYYNYGKLHRENGPADITYDLEKGLSEERYFENGFHISTDYVKIN